MNAELPAISKLQAHSTSYGGNELFGELLGQGQAQMPFVRPDDPWLEGRVRLNRLLEQRPLAAAVKKAALQKPQEKTMARIVRVFIADPNENIPLEKRVIHKSDEQLTDATDEELFFEADPAGMLKTHNEFRITVTDKKMTAATGKEVKLEPARIRDLKMIVVDVATF